jgi:hypothetical protein
MSLRDPKSEMLKARNALERMYLQMDELEVGIAKQKRVIAALTEIAEKAGDSKPDYELFEGFTDACKTTVWGSDKPLYPSEVRNRIERLEICQQKNVLASVTTTLKRLANYGEIKEEHGAYSRITFGKRNRRLSVRPGNASSAANPLRSGVRSATKSPNARAGRRD